MSAIPLSQLSISHRWQEDFLSVLPVVQNHARISFRHARSDMKEEAMSETVAAAFVAYGSLVRRGRLCHAYPSTLAHFAVKVVQGDRHVGSGRSSKDALSSLAQRKHGFSVHFLHSGSSHPDCPTLLSCEDRRTAIPDAVAFRLDFAQWSDRYNDRKRKVLLALAEGASTSEVAERFGLCSSRVSQLRREFQSAWEQMQGGSGVNTNAAVVGEGG